MWVSSRNVYKGRKRGSGEIFGSKSCIITSILNKSAASKTLKVNINMFNLIYTVSVLEREEGTRLSPACQCFHFKEKTQLPTNFGSSGSLFR